MSNAADRRAQRHDAAVQRLNASRTRLRTRLIRIKPTGGISSRLAELSKGIAVLVQRHPGFSAGGAVLLGALLMRARPWRWALTTGIWGALIPRALPVLAATLTASRLSLWSELIMNWMKSDNSNDADPRGPSAHASTRSPAPAPLPARTEPGTEPSP